MAESVLERFLRYVRIDTQSDPSSRTSPSTPGQWELLRLLAGELEDLGALDVRLTERGYVLATLPPNSPQAGLPTVALLAHVDTAPDFSGRGVRPLIHPDYDGRTIALPDDPTRVLDPSDPHQTDLRGAEGKTLVSAAGTTLLGADDKAGVAVVMTLAARLLEGTSVRHGPIRICFTPDEEIGRGVDHLDLKELRAEVAYTLDGGPPGEVSWETFSADEAVVTIRGVATHPGAAKAHGMVNAVYLAGKFLASLPRERLSPEATEAREGFVHPTRIEGDAGLTTVTLILRDHDDEALAAKRRMVRAMCTALQTTYPTARVSCRIRKQYRNMGRWLREQMLPVDLAREACAAVGLEAVGPPTRGGTDGARLTEKGLPTPNLFCGARNVHGPLEWVAVEDMEKAVQMLLELVQLWERKGAGFTGRQGGG